MHKKYCLHAHPCQGVIPPAASTTWRRMLPIQEIAEADIVFLPKNGKSDFWWDNWLGVGCLANKVSNPGEHKIKDFLLHHEWNLPLLQQWLPTDLMLLIQRTAAPS